MRTKSQRKKRSKNYKIVKKKKNFNSNNFLKQNK